MERFMERKTDREKMNRWMDTRQADDGKMDGQTDREITKKWIDSGTDRQTMKKDRQTDNVEGQTDRRWKD